jgi:hypothetical protein
MMMFFTSLAAVALLGQAQADRRASGEVVDDQGKPVADAQVVFYAPPVVYGTGDAVERQTKSDVQGKFSPSIPPLRRVMVNGIHFLAYRPGMSIAAQTIVRRPYRLVLRGPRPRTVKVEGPDGKPVAGARIVPRLLVIFGTGNVDVPPSLADSLATSTGADGQATISYLSARDQLAAVRVTADAIGTQDIVLIERPGRGSEPSAITIKLKPTTHLTGRVIDQTGQPVVDHVVEVWSRAEAGRPGPNTVEFKHGPLRTRADGSFQTPDNLMVGSTYRVAIPEDGKDPVISDWLTMPDGPRELPLFILRPLRTIRGRVVDRQGKPVTGVEVFQSGDGPEQTSTRTDAGGRFSLDGFRQGPVFVFVRADGFRFQGRLIKPAETEVTVEMTRVTERSARAMSMLPDPIPFDESLSLARRLAEPIWALAGVEGEDSTKYFVLSPLVCVDPARVLARLESVRFKTPTWKQRLQRELVAALAPTDFEEASAVAASIDDPATRSWALVDLADALPVKERERRLALLDRALLHARTATEPGDRLRRMAQVAERWYGLGEVDRAKGLCGEGLQVARQLKDKTDFGRALFAAPLALFDLPAAIAIGNDYDSGGVWGRIALGLVDHRPAEAERVWNLSKARRPGSIFMVSMFAWKLAKVDPTAALRVIEGPSHTQSTPFDYLFFALGAHAGHEAAALDAFQVGVQGIDRLLQKNSENYFNRAGMFLPIVERIEPALVPEVFWLDVSSRLPAGNPRTHDSGSTSQLVTRLAWYDREVAAALFEPARARIDQASGDPAEGWDRAFVAWSMFDPRAAVARLETLSVDSKLQNNATRARLAVAKSLAQTHEQRWREIWDDLDIIFGGHRLDD